VSLAWLAERGDDQGGLGSQQGDVVDHGRQDGGRQDQIALGGAGGGPGATSTSSRSRKAFVSASNAMRAQLHK
jgi:hypothetical protein